MAPLNTKPKKRYGTFVSQKSPEVLKKAQKTRLIYMYLSTLCFALLLFLPQEWAEKAKDVLALQTAFVIIVIALIVITVMASYGASRGCNITKPISERYKPRAGFENATFATVEWKMYLHYVLAAWEIAMLIYGFGLWGLLSALLSAGGAALATLSRIVSFKAMRDELVYSPPPEEIIPEKEDPETVKEENKKEQEQYTQKENSEN